MVIDKPEFSVANTTEVQLRQKVGMRQLFYTIIQGPRLLKILLSSTLDFQGDPGCGQSASRASR